MTFAAQILSPPSIHPTKQVKPVNTNFVYVPFMRLESQIHNPSKLLFHEESNGFMKQHVHQYHDSHSSEQP